MVGLRVLRVAVRLKSMVDVWFLLSVKMDEVRGMRNDSGEGRLDESEEKGHWVEMREEEIRR